MKYVILGKRNNFSLHIQISQSFLPYKFLYKKVTKPKQPMLTKYDLQECTDGRILYYL